MYNMTFEELLQRTLGRVSADVDKSEGSFIYDAIAPTVAELHNAYLYMNWLESQVFADTSTGEYLERRTAERGINRRKAIAAVRTITFNGPVPIGSRWGKEELIYTIQYNVNGNDYAGVCNTAGTVGNRYNGQMINIDAVSGITSAVLGSTIIGGTEDEADDQLRERYFNSFDSDAFGGNIQDYKNKVGEIEGVGQVKVYPTWNGAGTVKVAFLGNNGTVPDQTLIDKVQTAVDPTQNQGNGYGIAPIGHTVTVQGAEELKIDISFTLDLAAGITYPTIENDVKNAIEEYFSELRNTWSSIDAITVRIAHIESRILNVTGVNDITGTTLNNNAQNITLTDIQVPVLGVVTNV